MTANLKKGDFNMRIIVITITLLLFSCTANLPYTDISDAMELKYGMSKTKVENILGPPVKLSGEGTKETWLYDYRTLENKRLDWQDPVKGNSPRKVRGASEFYCVFDNNQLTDWGSCIGQCDESGNTNQAGFFSKIMKYKWPIIALVVIAAASSGSSDDDDDDKSDDDDDYNDY